MNEEIIYMNELENCLMCDDNKCDIKTCCGHTYCEKCLQLWIHRQNSCPLCRKDLTNTKYNIIARNIEM